jgi:phosphate:Na+ symporter
MEAAELLKVIGDLERISDHAVDLLKSTEEMQKKKLTFTDAALGELKNMTAAIDEILTLTLAAFTENNTEAAMNVEPLEQIIDALKEQLRTGHIQRLQQGQCSIETGFVWSDILTTLERTSDHCSNVAGCVLDAREHNLNIHQSLRLMKTESEHFRTQYEAYAKKYMPGA